LRKYYQIISWGCLVVMLLGCKDDPLIHRNVARPNIILIIADDLGYDDLRIYNPSGLETPQLELLAREGIALKNAYVTAPVCSPSRAGLLAGMYQQRFGYYHNFSQDVPKGIQGIPVKEKLISEFLKECGYINGLIGKWHVGSTVDFHPLNQGFDYFYGTLDGPLNYLPQGSPDLIETSWKPVTRDNLEENFIPVKDFNYLTDEFTNRAIDFIDEHKEDNFFLMVSYTTPHDPWQTVAKYYNQIEISDEPKRVRRIYLSMIKALDNGVGMINSKIKELGLEDNTMIIFLSDNGCKGTGPNICNPQQTFRGYKGTVNEGGIRIPFIIKDNSRTSVELEGIAHKNISSLDIYATLSEHFGLKRSRLDGQPFFEDEPRNLFWKYYSTAAVLAGSHKLMRIGRDFELYDLDKDPRESYNIINQNAHLTDSLKLILNKWEQPLPSPKWPL